MRVSNKTNKKTKQKTLTAVSKVGNNSFHHLASTQLSASLCLSSQQEFLHERSPLTFLLFAIVFCPSFFFESTRGGIDAMSVLTHRPSLLCCRVGEQKDQDRRSAVSTDVSPRDTHRCGCWSTRQSLESVRLCRFVFQHVSSRSVYDSCFDIV